MTTTLGQIAPPGRDTVDAYAEFRSALLDFFELPTAQNFRRYQAASRSLPEPPRSRGAAGARAAAPEIP